LVLSVTSAFYPLVNEVAKGYSNATIRPSVICVHDLNYLYIASVDVELHTSFTK